MPAGFTKQIRRKCLTQARQIKFLSRHDRDPTEHHLSSHGVSKALRNPRREPNSSPRSSEIANVAVFPRSPAACQAPAQGPCSTPRDPRARTPALPARAGRGQCACAEPWPRSGFTGKSAPPPSRHTGFRGFSRDGRGAPRPPLSHADIPTALPPTPGADFPFRFLKTLFRSGETSPSAARGPLPLPHRLVSSRRALRRNAHRPGSPTPLVRRLSLSGTFSPKCGQPERAAGLLLRVTGGGCRVQARERRSPKPFPPCLAANLETRKGGEKVWHVAQTIKNPP
nr:translation initiation factor IF-2-like [Peromyscus maniculatus bairdii]